MVKANTVTADVGGKLTIESLQDSSRFKESSQSAGGSVTVGYGAGGSVSVSATKVNSDYQSVIEQSAIRAGNGGFQVNVQGDTDLKAGAITSTQKAVDDNKNSFQTAKLTTSDLNNSASYSAESYSVTAGSNGGSAGAGQDSGSAQSTTKAAISGIAGNKAARTGDAETGIQKIFDQAQVTKEVNAQVAITQSFGQQASTAIGEYANKKAIGLRMEAAQESDPIKKQALLNQLTSWDEGGSNRVGLHALVGGLTGGVQGAVGAGSSAAATPVLAAGIANLPIPTEAKLVLIEGLGAAIGAATGGTTGAAAGFNETANNQVQLILRAGCYCRRTIAPGADV